MVGSGQYIFVFKVLRTDFEYSLQCLKYVRVRSSLRSLTWCWAGKEVRLIVGDSEEGVSVYNYDSGVLKLHGFDIAQRQVLYTDAVGD